MIIPFLSLCSCSALRQSRLARSLAEPFARLLCSPSIHISHFMRVSVFPCSPKFLSRLSHVQHHFRVFAQYVVHTRISFFRCFHVFGSLVRGTFRPSPLLPIHPHITFYPTLSSAFTPKSLLIFSGLSYIQIFGQLFQLRTSTSSRSSCSHFRSALAAELLQLAAANVHYGLSRMGSLSSIVCLSILSKYLVVTP